MHRTHDADQARRGHVRAREVAAEQVAAPVGAPRRPLAERRGRCMPTAAADEPEK